MDSDEAKLTSPWTYPGLELRFRAQGLRFRVQGLGFRGLRLRVKVSGSGLRVQGFRGLEIRVTPEIPKPSVHPRPLQIIPKLYKPSALDPKS